MRRKWVKLLVAIEQVGRQELKAVPFVHANFVTDDESPVRVVAVFSRDTRFFSGCFDFDHRSGGQSEMEFTHRSLALTLLAARAKRSTGDHRMRRCVRLCFEQLSKT